MFLLQKAMFYCCYAFVAILQTFFLLVLAQLMIRLNIAEIPEAHIMKCWTCSTKEVLPDHLKFLSKDAVTKKPLTHSSTMLNKNAAKNA
jgi:hypothetical protein